jgi:hypothetical protein
VKTHLALAFNGLVYLEFFRFFCPCLDPVERLCRMLKTSSRVDCRKRVGAKETVTTMPVKNIMLSKHVNFPSGAENISRSNETARRRFLKIHRI